MWLINPSGNAYDNHIEPIFYYGENFERPETFECWQCYQPPVYYLLTSSLYVVAKFVFSDPISIWKVVQILNPLLSIGILIFFFLFLKRLKVNESYKILLLSFVAFLPRDLFTSSVVSNDYLLVFTSLFACYYFLKFTDKLMQSANAKKEFLLMCLFVILGSLTKQHGMLLVGLPIYSLLHVIVFKKVHFLKFALPISILVIGLSLSEEANKYSKTGHFIVSNQHHYNYAENQFPGSLKDVEFHTFRITRLIKDPYLSERTAASFPTEIFARTFFDYEWRFLNPDRKWTHYLASVGYIIGVFWLVFFLYLLFLSIKKLRSFKDSFTESRFRYLALTLLAFCFMLVPVIQTIRYPYFSSMKSMFLLPGIFIMLMVFSRIFKDLKIKPTFLYPAVILSISYAIVLVVSIAMILQNSADNLSGPIWPILK